MTLVTKPIHNMMLIEILSCEPPHFGALQRATLTDMPDTKVAKSSRKSALIANDRIDTIPEDISSESIWTWKEIKRAKSRDGLAKALDAFPLATQNRIVSEITKESSIELNSHLVLCEILWQHFQ